MTMDAYATLETRFRQLGLLSETEAMLHWDSAAVMPPGGGEARSEQLAEIKSIYHGLLTADDMSDLLDAAETKTDLSLWQQSNLRLMRHHWTKATALTREFVETFSVACSGCEQIWRKARPGNDFATVLPYLQRVLDLTREQGAAYADVLDCSVFDGLLDNYEPGAKSSHITAVFDDLEQFLPDFLGTALDHQARRAEIIPLPGPFPVQQQKKLGETFMQRIGFDFDHGRLDVSLHPFCGGTPDDVRITTRYEENDFTKSLMGVLHETGHALYERGLPKKWRRQPVGNTLGMSIHESQSLLIEMQVCRSREFIEFAAPLMRDAFAGRGPAWEPENLYRLQTRIKPDFIRVDADEVTYPAHVILRYKLEKALIEGDMALSDLPSAWNEGLQKLLGITPPDDRLGCLQDVHWFDGAWGYFPTYTLGAMTAAQFYAAANDQDASIRHGIQRGDFKPLMTWLGTNIHGKGSSVAAPDLIRQVTGQPLCADIFKTHLETRYLS